nr:TrkA C-terminal domain-containing protein [uncultured Acetatifactor sp.]
MLTPTEWIGKNLIELNLRKKYKVNVIAVKRGSTLLINPPADSPTKKGDLFMILGLNSTLKKIASANAARRE